MNGCLKGLFLQSCCKRVNLLSPVLQQQLSNPIPPRSGRTHLAALEEAIHEGRAGDAVGSHAALEHLLKEPQRQPEQLGPPGALEGRPMATVAAAAATGPRGGGSLQRLWRRREERGPTDGPGAKSGVEARKDGGGGSVQRGSLGSGKRRRWGARVFCRRRDRCPGAGLGCGPGSGFDHRIDETSPRHLRAGM